jgi:ArsR family transcriptional regulator
MTPVELCKALADATRLRCLALITQHDELCVCELTHAIDEVQPKISRHLAQLRNSGVLEDERRGQWIYYRLHPTLEPWAQTIIESATQAWRAQTTAKQDQKRLKAMPNRPERCCG